MKEDQSNENDFAANDSADNENIDNLHFKQH